MLHRIGTEAEIRSLCGRFPEAVMKHLIHCTEVLDSSYGADRDYLTVGGYSLIAEDRNDISSICAVVDIETYPYEWVKCLDEGYLSILYLLGDDFAVVVFIPVECAPTVVLKDLEV